MANSKPTFFQRMNKFFGTDTTISADYTRRNVNTYKIDSPNVVFATKDKAEYDMKSLELRQNKLLNWKWRKANIQISNQQYMNVADVKMMYRDADLMDGFPEFGTACDILAEEACYTPTGGNAQKTRMVNVFSKSERIKAILEDLLYNRLQINMTLPMIARAGVKYGNCFMLHDIDINNGVRGWRQLPVYEVERYENMTSDNPYYTYFQNPNNIDLDKEGATRFVWIGQNEFTPYWNWQISHFRLLYDSQCLPYGCITGDSKIETEYGFKDMRNIKIGDKVWTFNTETQKRELATVSMQMNKGIKEVYRIGTFHNDIVATSDHKFLIYDGELKYKELDDIEIGDLLVIDNLSERNYKEIPIDKSYPREGECNLDKNMNWWKNYSQFIPDYVDEEFARFFGFMLGDGWITYGRYVFFATGEYSSMNNEFKQYLEKITGKEARFLKPKNKSDHNYEFSQVVVCSKSLSLILKRMGFDGRFNEKRIPDWVFSASTSIKKAFLNGLMAADGSYNIDKYDILRCQLEVANEGLVRDAKCLAQSLGYKTSKVNYRNRIGKTTELGSGRKIVTKHESYYFYYYESQNTQEKKYDLKNRKEYGFKTEKVRVKEFVGERETYDITVDNENSNFFANGIVTHNCSFFNKARRHFRMLSMMEDAMLMYRLERAVERRVFKVNVASINEDDVQAFVEDVANEFKRTPIIDPLTGQLDLRKNLISNSEDFFIPVRDPNEPNPIETLQAGQNLTALDDIKYVLNKILIALRIPKAFLNFEETAGDGKNLSLMDVRFMRTVNRVQQMLLLELNKVCIIHLAILGFTDDLTNFTLTMNNPSSQAEMLEIENLAKKITTAKDAITDGGNGIPLYSCIRAWKEIMGWSEKEIADNLEELRLETALAAELQKTAQIIKRTGLFDKVDNIYGEPGAEYNENGGGEEGDDGMPGGGGGGGAAAFGGDMDMGAPEGEDVEGGEGDMGLDQAADEAAGGETSDTGGEGGGNDMQVLSETILNRKMKQLQKRKTYIKEDILARSKKYSDMLLKKLNEKKRQEEEMLENIPLYNKSFFVNEELDTMSRHLDAYMTERRNGE